VHHPAFRQVCSATPSSLHDSAVSGDLSLGRLTAGAGNNGGSALRDLNDQTVSGRPQIQARIPATGQKSRLGTLGKKDVHIPSLP
jgi:hypothetical protein